MGEVNQTKRCRCLIHSNKLIKNNHASFWLPIRLLISIAIISFFTVLLVIGSQNATNTIINNDVLNEIQQIKQSLESLYYHGDCRNLHNLKSFSGSKRVFSIEIPYSIQEVYFGKKENESNEMSSSIRFQLSEKTKIIWLPKDIKLVLAEKVGQHWYPKDDEIGLSLKNGYYDVTAELVCNNSDQFILLYLD